MPSLEPSNEHLESRGDLIAQVALRPSHSLDFVGDINLWDSAAGVEQIYHCVRISESCGT